MKFEFTAMLLYWIAFDCTPNKVHGECMYSV